MGFIKWGPLGFKRKKDEPPTTCFDSKMFDPLLGEVNLDKWLQPNCPVSCSSCTKPYSRPQQLPLWKLENRLEWVIVRGDEGENALPMHPNWVRSIRNQCQAAEVPFYFAQWGEWGWYQGGRGSCSKYQSTFVKGEFDAWMVRVGKNEAGRLLDGRTWDETPWEGVQLSIRQCQVQ